MLPGYDTTQALYRRSMSRVFTHGTLGQLVLAAHDSDTAETFHKPLVLLAKRMAIITIAFNGQAFADEVHKRNPLCPPLKVNMADATPATTDQEST